MSAAVTPLAERPPLTWRCPHCHRQTELRGGPTYATPLGIRRFRHCGQCRRGYVSLEHVAGYYHDAALPVPLRTPAWALAVAGWIVRVGCWLGGGR